MSKLKKTLKGHGAGSSNKTRYWHVVNYNCHFTTCDIKVSLPVTGQMLQCKFHQPLQWWPLVCDWS